MADGDSPALASELAELIAKGIKTATCGSLASYQKEGAASRIGSYIIVLNGQEEPACVVRLVSARLVRYCHVTAEFARKEGEGDLSLEYWRKEHQRFFTQEGTFLRIWSWLLKSLRWLSYCNSFPERGTCGISEVIAANIVWFDAERCSHEREDYVWFRLFVVQT